MVASRIVLWLSTMELSQKDLHVKLIPYVFSRCNTSVIS